MTMREQILKFFASTAIKVPGPSVSARGPGTLFASPLYQAEPLASPSAADYARVLEEWAFQSEDELEFTWSDFISNLDQRRRFYTAERREREAELAALQSRIKPLP